MEVITRAQFQQFADDLADSLDSDADNARDPGAAEALRSLSHHLQSFDFDYLFAPHAPHNQPPAPEPEPEPDPLAGYRTRSDHEAKALQLMDKAMIKTNYDDAVVEVAKFFKMEWVSSHPVSKIVTVVQAMDPNLSQDDVKAALAKMVRGDWLRSRVAGGVRRWEVNY